MNNNTAPVRIRVLGVGGAGGNAVARIASRNPLGLELLALNTDVQALGRMPSINTFAIGPTTTGGMGSGGDPAIGRKSIRESIEQVGQLVKDADLVFIAAGMGGGTGTGAAPMVADLARKSGALTVGVVTRPFTFEGTRRSELSEQGLSALSQKVDTIITVDNDRLLSSLDGEPSLDEAFRMADEVLRQGVEGIAEIVSVPGLINVDFADVRSLMTNGGPSFMAIGEGKGKRAAEDAIDAALSNPLFDAPLHGCSGIMLNVKGGKDLTLTQVHRIAAVVRDASHSDTEVLLGVVNDKKWKNRVGVTLVATGIRPDETHTEASDDLSFEAALATPGSNGHSLQPALATRKLL